MGRLNAYLIGESKSLAGSMDSRICSIDCLLSNSCALISTEFL